MKNIVTGHIWSRKIIYCMEVYRLELSYKACYTMHCNMEINTKEIMDAFVFKNFGYDSKELVLRARSA
jgi:hypothetical protein